MSFYNASLLKSVQGYRFNHPLPIFLINTHICQRKRIQINAWEQFKDSSFTSIVILPGKVHKNETYVFMGIYNCNCLQLLSILKCTGLLAQLFNIIIQVLFMSFTLQNPRRLFWLWAEEIERRMKVQNTFLIQVDECRLGTKVSKIIEISSICLSENMGQSILSIGSSM